MSEGRKRKVHSPEFKAKVRLEALGGVEPRYKVQLIEEEFKRLMFDAKRDNFNHA